MRTIITALILAIVPAAFADDDTLFDAVVAVLESRYVDQPFREDVLPGLIDEYRDMADAATDLRAQREVTHALLSRIPASHLGLLSKSSHDRLIGELMNRSAPTYGFELIEYDGKYFAHQVLEGGPAASAGLKRGDRILFVNDRHVDSSPLLDWRTDDSFLPDPPVHALLCEEGDAVTLHIEREWGVAQSIRIQAAPYSAFEATKASTVVVDREGSRIGCIHYWYMHVFGVGDTLKQAIEGPFEDCDALIIDLRGRGGSAAAIADLFRVLEDWPKPVVALIDNHSRSAKEVIAYEMRRRNVATLVGESTAGAVIPATFQDVGHDTYLMFPATRLGRYTTAIEGVGVAPHVVVEDSGPYAAGRDSIFEAGVNEAVRLAEADRRVVSNDDD